MKTLKPHIIILSFTAYMMAVNTQANAQAKADTAVNNQQLKGVEITAKKSLVRQEADRIVYDLKADPDSKGSSVLDMMRKVPFVSLDAEQNILLKGNAGFKIFINGKPSGMMEQNAKEVLRSMPASTIEKIEVITNPPAKYDAEGFAGIINIVTNKTVGEGYNGTLNFNQSYPTGGPGVGSSFNFKAGKLIIATTAGGSLSRTPETQNSVTRNTFNNPTSLYQNGNRRSNGKTGYLGTELSYEFNKFQLLSAQFNISGNSNDEFNQQQSSLNNAGGVIQGYRLQNDYKRWGNGLDVSLNYQYTFHSKTTKLLNLGYRYTDYGNQNNNTLTLSQRVNYTAPDFLQENIAGTNEHTFQADYSAGTKKLGFETGVKAILRNNNSDYRYISSNTTGNKFNISQDVISAYSSLSFNVKKWDFKAGLRAEETLVGGDISNNYLNVVPSFAASVQLDAVNSLNFGFSQRLRRPGINRLNPFVDRSNPNYEFQGNPNLNPSTINNFTMGYNTSGKVLSMNIGLGYFTINNIDQKIYTYNSGTGITQSTYANVAKGDALSADVNMNFTATKKLSFSFNGNLTYLNVRADAVLLKTEGLFHNFTVSGSYRPLTSWRLGANVNVIGRNPTSAAFQSITAAQVNTSLSSTHELIKSKLSFTATLNNPFHKFRTIATHTTGVDFDEISNNQFYLRTYRVSLNYNFGKLKDAVKKTKKSIRNDDVSN